MLNYAKCLWYITQISFATITIHIMKLNTYLHDEILKEFLVGTLIVTLLADHLVLGFLVNFLNKGVHSPHLLDSLGILLSRLLDSQLNLVLLESVLILLGKSLLFFSNVFFLLDGEFIFSLLVNSCYSFITMASDESDHGLKYLWGFLWVHLIKILIIFIKYTRNTLL